MSPLLIVNPKSGGGRTGRTFGDMRKTIEGALGPFDVTMTERPRHAVAIAKEASEAGRDLVVAVGGDGTFSEVVNGVMRAPEGKRAQIGLIAQGTGGDFRRTLGLEHRLDHYLAALKRGTTRQVDVGKFTCIGHDGKPLEHYFVNILSAGMGGLVDRYVAESPSFLTGKAAYYTASARALASCVLGKLRCKVTLEGKTEERKIDTFVIAVCNGRHFGGGMHPAPMAEIDDGVFEVVTLGPQTKAALIATSNKIYGGEHLKVPGALHFRCDAIDIDLENEEAREVYLLDVDGEPLGRLPLRIEMVAKAITLVA